MALEIVRAKEPVRIPDHSFYLEVPNGGYGRLHVSDLGGNCKMCTVSNIGNVSWGQPERADATMARIKELFKKYKKLVFQVNISNYELIKLLCQHFEPVDIRCIPIGYRNNGKADQITYLGTFFAYKGFHSNGVTRKTVQERMKDKELRKRMRQQERNLMRIKRIK